MFLTPTETHINDNKLAYWLAASHVFGMQPKNLLMWYQHYGNIDSLFTSSVEELLAAGISPKIIAKLQNPNWDLVDQHLTWLQREAHHCVIYDDVCYPKALKAITDPPLVLYVHGNKHALNHLQLAIVGARNATAMGKRNAEQFALAIANAGVAITSGLASGIDTAAHRGALQAVGITLAVAGTGLNQVYPPSNRELAQEIVNKNGAIISEFPLHTRPHAYNFPRRNRIIAGLSVGVLVVEALLKSGSLVTARHAMEHGREVFALPNSIHHPLARGCHHLIRQGAKLCETPADILEELAIYVDTDTKKKSTVEAKLTSTESQVLQQIGDEIIPIDVIIFRSGLTASEVSSILLTLELQGYINCVTGGYVRVFA